MRTVILASHGHLASGMKNTVEMILGEQERSRRSMPTQRRSAMSMTHWRRCSVRQTENASSLRMCWVAA